LSGAAKRLAPDAEHVILLANPVLPHKGEIVLTSADPNVHPSIRLNYYDDPHDMKGMRAVVRRALDIAAHSPGNRRIGPVLIPPFLAKKHSHVGDAEPEEFTPDDQGSPPIAARNRRLARGGREHKRQCSQCVEPRLRRTSWGGACAWSLEMLHFHRLSPPVTICV
jgi:hypothetical protein